MVQLLYNLKKFIDEVRAKGGTIIFVTPHSAGLGKMVM